MNDKSNSSFFSINIPNFVGLILMTALGLIIGGYIGVSYQGEHDPINNNALSPVELLKRETRKASADVNLYVEILFALKKGEYTKIEEMLHVSVRGWFQPPDKDIFGIMKQSIISEGVTRRASEYQSKYCSDECLGIEIAENK